VVSLRRHLVVFLVAYEVVTKLISKLLRSQGLAWYPAPHDPLIPTDLFERAHAKLTERCEETKALQARGDRELSASLSLNCHNR
jgi:hypothetical protein